MNKRNSHKVKWICTDKWRQCVWCWKFKLWIDFNNNKSWYNWKTTRCNNCIKNGISDTFLFKNLIIDEELSFTKYKKYRDYLDNIFYNDPQIKRNELIKSTIAYIRNSEYQKRIDKIFFLAYKKWFDINKVCLVYNIPPKVIQNIKYGI